MFLSFTASMVYGQQTGRIAGKVVDAETGETIIGASVIIEGTSKGAATDIDGNYNIRNLEPGIYIVLIHSISYTRQRVTGIEVKAGEVYTLDVALTTETESLNELVVTAQAVLNNEAGLLSLRKRSISFSDAISAENISKSGAGTAAAAMRKVTGASVVSGKYVYVRGLGDRYTTSHLNGLELPSSNPDKKSFQLDLLPSNLIENIVTLKTFTPDKPGNFSGGLVDITTKSIPERLFFTVSLKQGYNTTTSLNDLLLGEKGATDWLGYDNGMRGLPLVVAERQGTTFPGATQARFSEEAAADLDLIARSFNSTFLPQERTVGLNQSYSIGFGNRHQIKDNIDFGYSLNYSYGLDYSGYSNGRNGRFMLLGQFDDVQSLERNYDLNDQKGSQLVDWGFLGTAGLIVGSSTKINFNYLQTQSGENTGRYLNGYWQQLNSETREFRSRANQFTERDLSSYQLSGKHSFKGLNNIQLDWNTAIQSNGQNQPDFRVMASDAQFVMDNNTGMIVDTLLNNDNSQHSRPARLFRELNENKLSGTVDLTIPFELPNQIVKLKVGGLLESTERDFIERRYDIRQGNNFFMNQFDSEEEFLSQVGILGYNPNNNQPIIGNYVVSATTDRSAYDATQDISALYAMIDFNLTRKLKLATGVRYEFTKMQSASRDTTLLDSDRFGEINNKDLLPSAILIYSLTENVNLRAAVSRTVALPTFRELAPYISFDFVGSLLFRGNPNLERTLITNYDLRWEYYPTPGELYTISGFYKTIENPIERVLRFDISVDAESIQNVDNAEVFGVEFEARKRLGFLGDFFEPFQITANLTLVHSEVDIPEAELVEMRKTKSDPDTKRALSGQSPYIVNVDLGYENPRIGLATNLSFNKFGDRLSNVTYGGAPNVFERSYSSLNFNLNKNLGRFIELSFSANNLLDPNVTYSQIFKGDEYLYQQYKRGRTYSLGVKYNF
jgi:outer membrane receptor protein involved in Fe transport